MKLRYETESEVQQHADNISELNVFQTYWRLYGGWHAIFGTPYPYIALFLSLILTPVWWEEVDNERVWTSSAVEIIPSLMAFSLGGMAILLAFSNEKLMTAVQEDGKSDSLYMKTTASFFHFILAQTLSLLAVFLVQAYSIGLFSWFGFFLLVYGLLVSIAVAGNLMKLAQIFNLKNSN